MSVSRRAPSTNFIVKFADFNTKFENFHGKFQDFPTFKNADFLAPTKFDGLYRRKKI